MSDYTKKMEKSSTLFSSDYLESLYENYLHDPSTVPASVKNYFDAFGVANDTSHEALKEKFLWLSTHSATQPVEMAGTASPKQEGVNALIESYRRLGHFAASIDPLGLEKPPAKLELSLDFHGLSQTDLSDTFQTTLPGLSSASLKDIVAKLKSIYTANTGFEFFHINKTQERLWLQQKIEAGRRSYSAEEKIRFLKKLLAAEGLEKYLGTKYTGQKRFSIEGMDALIPMMDALTLDSAKRKIAEVVVGMAHRGRLNMLVNFLGKAPADLFSEFDGKSIPTDRSGDVKYHKGYSSFVQTPHDVIHLAMAHNPSHLEIINPVVLGSVKAKQIRRNNSDAVMAVLLHGDGAFSSQGVVQESLNLSQVSGYAVGGTFHIVTNNQVAFTTSAMEGRSTPYCTDVMKMLDAPIIHVNGDDVEACIFAVELMAEFRATFKKDVAIDLVAYRRHGHQEVDEPNATQPLMYQQVRQQLTPFKRYAEQLQKEGVATEVDINTWVQEYKALLDSGKTVLPLVENAQNTFAAPWKKYQGQNWREAVNTGVSLSVIKEISQFLTTLTGDFVLQPQVQKQMEHRLKMLVGETAFDWGAAETLAYATLLKEGIPIRISGEDVQRGTFSHRHAVLSCQKTGEKIMPLSKVSKTRIGIFNSILSEEAVMGFETGYSSAAPDELVIWEAQFGDFANGAQVIVDQFLSSGEQKWGQKSGLVLFLPHGQEGQGPEHSSARLERYLQLCAQNNMQVCMPTTPAQIFHLLRRQMHRSVRKPLIVMTPKSMLRAPLAVSSLEDIAAGQFDAVISDKLISSKNVKKIVFCTGKIYYDLFTARQEKKRDDIALIRVEQLYPFPDEEIAAILKSFALNTPVVWCQEEPLNQGAWMFVEPLLKNLLGNGQSLTFVSRKAAAAPACGYLATYLEEQKAIVQAVMS
jgi:2-oxoglutarate dehydrogenase E1 component